MKNIYFLIVLLLFTTNINAQIFKEKYINDATKIANEWLDNVINKDYGIAYSNYSNEVKIKLSDDIAAQYPYLYLTGHGNKKFNDNEIIALESLLPSFT